MQFFESSGVETNFLGGKVYGFFDIYERSHESPGRIYNKLAIDLGYVDKNLMLEIAVNLTNDTIGENSLLPMQLVSAKTTRLSIKSAELSKKKGTTGKCI